MDNEPLRSAVSISLYLRRFLRRRVLVQLDSVVDVVVVVGDCDECCNKNTHGATSEWKTRQQRRRIHVCILFEKKQTR